MNHRRTLPTLLLLLAVVAPLGADEVRTLGGKTVTGTLADVNDKEIALRTDKGTVTLPLNEVLALDLREVKGVPGGTKFTDVRLLDDTSLLCSKVAFSKSDVLLTLLSGQT